MSIIDNSTPLTLNPSQNTQMINTINTNTQSFVNCNMLSNSVYITSNTLNTKINLKQDTLIAGTNLLGVGSAITALDWNKITLNKPTIYTQTETNNLLNAKEAILTFSSPLTRTTNTIGINLSSYSTTGNDTSYLLKTGGTMTGALLNTSTTASEFKGIYILHSTGRQSHLPYLPNEQFYFRASVNIDNVNDYLSMGSRLGDNIIRLFSNDYGFGINSFSLRYNAPAGAFHRFYHGTTNTCWINDAGRLKATTFEGSGSALTNIPYSALTGTPTIYTQTETNNLLNAKEAILTFSSPLTRTTNTIGINLSSYSTTGNDTNYVLKSGSTMTGTLNGTTIYTTGNVGVGTNNNIASLVVGNIDADGSDGSIAFSKRQNAGTKRNFKMGMNGDYTFCIGDYGSGNTTANSWSVNHFNIRYADGNVGIGIQGSGSYKLYVDGTTYFNGNSSINGTCSATTFSGSGANLTNLPLSAYSTTGNDSSYVLKTGSTMSGALNITSTTTDNQIIITNSSATRYTSIKFNNGTTNGYIGVGGSGLTGTSYYNNNVFIEANNSFIIQTGNQNTANVPRMIINTSGNVGIATTNPNSIFQVGDGARLRISNGSNDYSLIGTKNVDDNTNTRIVVSGNNRTSYEGRIEYLATAGDHIFYTSAINERMRILNNGNIGINNTNPRTILHIKGTSPALTIMGAGGSGATSQLNLSTYDHTTNAPNCSLIAVDTGTFGATFQINQKTTGADANSQFTSLFINSSGNVGIGTITTIDEKLHLHTTGTNNAFIKANASGTGQCGLRLFAGSNTSNRATRIDFFNNVASTTLARWSILNDTDQNGTNDFRIYNAGSITNVFTILQSGFVGIGTLTPKSALYVNGRVGINNGSEYAITSNHMASGSLTIGGISGNYGCGNNWTTNTAGLMMECSNNTEIMIHDSGTRLVSPMAYYGGDTNRIYIGRDAGWGSTPITIPNSLTIDGTLNFGSRIQDYLIYLYGDSYGFGINGSTLRYNSGSDHKFYGGSTNTATIDSSGNLSITGSLKLPVNKWLYDGNGNQRIYFGSGARTYYQGYGSFTTDINHDWFNHSSTSIMRLSNTGSLVLEGEIIPRMTSIGTSGTDCCGVSFNSSQGTIYQTSIKIIFGTFTGFHRCFSDDIEFKEEEPQKFKDDYVGRIVISSGKIATDTKIEMNEEEWTIKYDKEGITIEDALPIIQLSRKKKDKRVFGVLGLPKRANSRVERMIVNSVGEGAVWVCNSNGNIENGDYIQSSDHLGYGEKQDDDILHNYSVAKATMDCNFELDNPNYECFEIDDGLRVAFIACTYHCG